MGRKGDADLDSEGDRYYAARVGAERAWRGMVRRCKDCPDGLRQAAGLADEIRGGKKQYASTYFHELRDYLRASVAASEKRVKK